MVKPTAVGANFQQSERPSPEELPPPAPRTTPCPLRGKAALPETEPRLGLETTGGAAKLPVAVSCTLYLGLKGVDITLTLCVSRAA